MVTHVSLLHVLRAQVQHSETGDALWVARARGDRGLCYALDYVVERKSVSDLVSSIKGGRYERQKYALRRCGLRRVMYLVEGTPEAEVQGVRGRPSFPYLHTPVDLRRVMYLVEGLREQEVQGLRRGLPCFAHLHVPNSTHD